MNPKALETLKIWREFKHQYEDSDKPNDKLKATAIYYRIVGYTQALKDCGIVTEKEYQKLFADYALTPSNVKQKTKEHFKNLVKMREKIGQIAADKEATTFTEALKEKEQS